MTYCYINRIFKIRICHNMSKIKVSFCMILLLQTKKDPLQNAEDRKGVVKKKQHE